ncbi:hypothetical protein D3C85_1541430 [compost metagenome]
MGGGHVHHGAAGRPYDIQRLNKPLARHLIHARQDGGAEQLSFILVLKLSGKLQGNLMLSADSDDLMDQRADLFVVHVFFGRENSSPAVHRQAGRWFVEI